MQITAQKAFTAFLLEFWTLTKRALSWFDPNSTPKFYIRWGAVRMIALMFGLFFGWYAPQSEERDKDFSIRYPEASALDKIDGSYTQGKRRHDTHFLFRTQNGTVYELHPYKMFNYVQTQWFRDRYGSPVWWPASGKIYRMPSGEFWLAELAIKGQPAASYEQRRNDFFDRRSWLQTGGIHIFNRFAARYAYYFCIAMLVSAYAVAWIQLKRERARG